jgi:hypothetical protein
MFAVIWGNAALDELADAFVLADLPTRQGIESQVTQLNADLADDPMGVGESRAQDTYRIVFAGHVSATYQVNLTNRVVRVGHFRWS